MRIAVVGASGFIGCNVLSALRNDGHIVSAVTAPRLTSRGTNAFELRQEAESFDVDDLVAQFRGHDAVVNAAGLATATSNDRATLLGANSLLPALLWRAAARSGVTRFVHISSAAVQGRTQLLDESTAIGGDSPYARSKVLGEQVLGAYDDRRIVIYRPTSVHGPGRAVTSRLASLASSRLAVVAAPGNDPTPQVHVSHVAEAVRVLCTVSSSVPPVVLHPSEGFTTSTFLTTLSGGRPPYLLPRTVATLAVRVAFAAAWLSRGALWGRARRIEMLLFGQRQTSPWLLTVAPDLGATHPGWSSLQ